MGRNVEGGKGERDRRSWERKEGGVRCRMSFFKAVINTELLEFLVIGHLMHATCC